MWISRYVCLFMVYSSIGWIYETIFCTIKGGRWENRGFLYGPVCPIYGASAILISSVAGSFQTDTPLPFWQIFLISAVSSGCLEYITSWLLERIFHAIWWDYSRLPLNIHGRVSLFTSLGFGAAGLLLVYYIAPFLEKRADALDPVLTEFLSLLFVSLLMTDVTLTVTSLLHFDRVVIHMENTFNRNMTVLVENTFQKTSRLRSGFSEKQKSLGERLGQLSRINQSAVRRIRTFRYDATEKERANAVLKILKKKNESDDFD